MSCPVPLSPPPIIGLFSRLKCTQSFDGGFEEVTYASYGHPMTGESYDSLLILPVGTTWANGGGAIRIEPLGPFVPVMLGWRIVTVSGGGAAVFDYRSQMLFTQPVEFAADALGSVDDYSYKDNFGLWRLL